MKKTIRDFHLEGKKVIIRCDLNVPIKDGIIKDDTRIRKSLETINYAKANNAKIIILSHLGRIKTLEDKEVNDLNIVSKRLEELLNQPVTFINETRGKTLENAINNMNNQDIILIQNTRYEDLPDKLESTCDESLSKYWASLGDIFINDAFGTLHRAHASNVGISKYLPSGIGLLVEKELSSLNYLFNADKPFIIILGGSKVNDKIGVIENLIKECDKLLIGGGMAFTFLKADGYDVGNSIVDESSLDFCKRLLKEYHNKIVLPVDVICNDSFIDKEGKKKDITEIKDDLIGLDIGPDTIEIFKNNLQSASSILWNGPLGVYEFTNYSKGTNEILKYISTLPAKAVLGGGDIIAAATNFGYVDKLYHASTGGGATLEFLEGKDLPGLKNIEEV